MPEGLKAFSQTIVPLSPEGILGIDSLRRLGKVGPEAAYSLTNESVERVDGLPMLSKLIEELVAPGHGVILAMGKGVAGQTTVAAAIAVAIAQRGFDVHLSTTDPAAHIEAAMNDESLPTLSVSRIDPQVETAKYSAEVLGKAGKNLDQKGKALLEEDLRSPCSDADSRSLPTIPLRQIHVTEFPTPSHRLRKYASPKHMAIRRIQARVTSR